MMESLPVTVTALLIGLLGGVHCIGMCGGISAALALAAPVGGAAAYPPWQRQLCYGLGRVLSYGVAGALVGTLGMALADTLGPRGAFALRVLAAGLLMMIALQLGGWWAGASAIERAGARVWAWITPTIGGAGRNGSLWQALGIGAAWGWLPCGLVYTTLAWAASSADPIEASMRMFFFGLGTVPAVSLTGLAASRFSSVVRKPGTRRLAGLLMAGFALWTLLAARSLLATGGEHCAPGIHHPVEGGR